MAARSGKDLHCPISCTTWPVPSAGVSITQNWKQHRSWLNPKQLQCSIATVSFCAVLWRLSTSSEVGSKPQMRLSISARPDAAQKTSLLFTVQLFLTATRGQSLLPDGKSCQEQQAGPHPKGIKAPQRSTSAQEQRPRPLRTRTSQGQETGKCPTYSYLVLGNIEWGNQIAQKLLNELEIVASDAPGSIHKQDDISHCRCVTLKLGTCRGIRFGIERSICKGGKTASVLR